MHKTGSEDVTEVIARWHVHFPPTATSWLHQIAYFFALLAAKQFGRGISCATQKGESASRNDATPSTPIRDLSDGPTPSASSAPVHGFSKLPNVGWKSAKLQNQGIG